MSSTTPRRFGNTNMTYCIILVQFICFLGVGKITIVGQNKRQQLGFSEFACLCRTLVPTNCWRFCLNFIYPWDSEKAKTRKEWKVWTHGLACTSTDQRCCDEAKMNATLACSNEQGVKCYLAFDIFICLRSKFENHTWLQPYLSIIYMSFFPFI